MENNKFSKNFECGENVLCIKQRVLIKPFKIINVINEPLTCSPFSAIYQN